MIVGFVQIFYSLVVRRIYSFALILCYNYIAHLKFEMSFLVFLVVY